MKYLRTPMNVPVLKEGGTPTSSAISAATQQPRF